MSPHIKGNSEGADVAVALSINCVLSLQVTRISLYAESEMHNDRCSSKNGRN